MQLDQWITTHTKNLLAANIATARLDCLVLLEDITGKDRSWLLSHPEYELQGSEIEKLSKKITQRALHTPLAYIRGKAEFYGREFAVNAHTLVPRPETETMIELLKRVRNMEADVAAWQIERRGRKPSQKHYPFEKLAPKSSLVKTDDGYKVVWQKLSRPSLHQPTAPVHGQSLKYHDEDLCIVDIGTGSGAIAITAKLELPEVKVIATDIDSKCINVATANAQKLGAEITFLEGNLLQPLHSVSANSVILLCNLPYVPDNFQINTAATHEPRHALYGGPDGLDLYRGLFDQARTLPIPPQYILTEALPPQHETLAAIAKAAGYSLETTDDFIQVFQSMYVQS